MSDENSNQRVGSWIASILGNSPLALVIGGSALFFMAATGGVPSWSVVLSDLPWRIAVAVLGVGLIVSGAVVGYLAPRTASRQGHALREHEVPVAQADSLRLPFLARRAELTQSQRELLDFIEQETRKRATVSQQEIEGRFKFEVYWRLETLCYLGFCEKEVAGRRGEYDFHNYRLLPAYRKVLQNEKPGE